MPREAEAPARALFHPVYVGETEENARHALVEEGEWVRMVEAPAYYSLESWLATMREWIQFPERNSSSIRRCEVWDEDETACDVDDFIQKYKCIRRLLPRRTQIDRGMLQECAIFADATHGQVVYTTLRASDQETEQRDANALQRGRAASDFPQHASEVPYYHPAVRCVAFRYSSAVPATYPEAQGTVSVAFVPFSASQGGAPLDENGRLGRTALSLLRLLHQHSYGHATSYVKRVVHDVLVPRDTYQDLYIALRTEYANDLIQSWAEVTDPKKHVFEDLGIAAYLMLLWKDMFSPGASLVCGSPRGRSWGQPPGGFVDVGCGNGLLVYILSKEGYHGYGFDARERKSWPNYAKQGAVLHACMFDAPGALRGTSPALPSGAFLIGNHADELTPWVPVLAAITPYCSGFVNIPCCAWTLEGARFTPTHLRLDEAEIGELLCGEASAVPAQPPMAPHTIPHEVAALLACTEWFVQRLVTAPDADQVHSKHLAYYAYVARLHMRAGWVCETEALRIPSTKNWALVARSKVPSTMRGTEARAVQWANLKAHAAQCAAVAAPCKTDETHG